MWCEDITQEAKAGNTQIDSVCSRPRLTLLLCLVRIIGLLCFAKGGRARRGGEAWGHRGGEWEWTERRNKRRQNKGRVYKTGFSWQISSALKQNDKANVHDCLLNIAYNTLHHTCLDCTQRTHLRQVFVYQSQKCIKKTIIQIASQDSLDTICTIPLVTQIKSESLHEKGNRLWRSILHCQLWT